MKRLFWTFMALGLGKAAATGAVIAGMPHEYGVLVMIGVAGLSYWLMRWYFSKPFDPKFNWRTYVK